MNKMRSVVVGAVLLVGSTAGATAADLWVPAGGMKDGYGTPVPHSVSIADGARWYLRGDIGYVWNNDDAHAYARDQYLTGVHHELNNLDIEDVWSFGGGIGYYFSHNWRMDLTADWRQSAKLRGTTNDSHATYDPFNDNDIDNDGNVDTFVAPGAPFTGNPAGSISPLAVYDWDRDGDGIANRLAHGGITYEVQDPATGEFVSVRTHIGGNYEYGIQTSLYMANFYYDFGGHSYSGMKDGGGSAESWLRPYLGFAVGLAHHKIDRGLVQAVCTCGQGELDGDSELEAAFAVMAGVSRELRSGLKMDLGYRFTYMGNVATSATVAQTYSRTNTNNDVTYNYNVDVQQHTEDLTSHEIRFGLRYDIW
ncbi:MAG: hypothetical protein GC150_05065 [Rhizobiales bacterium]|nr:hypothetical protein [Hyphomicrobiales bacterium]